MSSPLERPIEAEHGALLLQVARASVEYGLECAGPLPLEVGEYPPGLRVERASFVTLRVGEALRGCIGSSQPIRPLVEDVACNAYAASCRDLRFAPLEREELHELHIHISVLSALEALEFHCEAELLRQVRAGVDGLLLVEDRHRAILLPAVWEVVPEPAAFLGHLKRKAGLPADYWSDTLQVFCYTAQSIG